jgi:asparagine synthase (glutamine-hydrolysing)
MTAEAGDRDVRRMAETLVHRGPDASGFWNADGAHLGHRRLSIIDLETGDQPMVGDSGCVIVHNGEIYNYRELRAELEAKGDRFRTHSDTEVLLKAFERFGEDCLEKLVGMFAFAVWDPGRRRLFLARDRLGKKPLFYYQGRRFFAFASEIKALLTLDAVRRDAAPDCRALSDFLSLGYVLTPKTAFSNIHQLPAAHSAEYRVNSHTFTTREYWHLEDHVKAPREVFDDNTRDRFGALLDDAVRIRLRADVPLGGFLSGGVDSSSVVAAIARQPVQDLRTFCVGFREESYDETPYAQMAADHLGVELSVLDHDVFEEDALPGLVWHTDEPFADNSMVPTYLLNRSTTNHVRVALSGDGADEILAGYPTYRADALYRFYRHVPGGAQRAAAWLARRLLRPSYGKVSWDFKARQFLASHGLSRAKAHYWWRVIFSEREKARLMGPDLIRACEGYSPFDTFDAWFGRVEGASFLDRTLFVDIKTWLQDDTLVKVDRMSMANSLEVRSPFLDHRLVEFCARLPTAAKIDGRRQKVILKDRMRGRLPRQILARAKRGFNAPTRRLGRNRINRDVAGSLFNPDFRLDPKTEDVTFKSFSLAILDIWLGLFAEYQHSGNWK